jgi:hypothetical protein
MERYLQDKKHSILPRLIKPRVILPFWILFLVVMIGVGFVGASEFPVYSTGLAVERPQSNDVLVLLPQDHVPVVGQIVILDDSTRYTIGHISRIEPGILTPAELQNRFGLQDVPINNPVFVAVIENPDHLSNDQQVIYVIEVEVGSRPVVSLLPIIGKLFD